ncbi:unnamed protein product [Closterium sp. Naga37s-1]|nr:unnamed protein product [Closterium sp. Naga37s-1]
MAPKTHAKPAETDAQQLKTKLETEPLSKSLTGTVIPDETSFNIEAEIKALGGLEVLVPGKLEPTLIRQHLDESLLKAFNCASNVHLSTSYAYQALALYCGKDSVALRGFGKFFWKRALEEQMTFKDIAAFVYSHFVISLVVGTYSFAALPFLVQAAEMSGDAGAQNFIENRLLKPEVLALQRCARYVTQIRRVGKGTGEYQLDHHMLMGVDIGEMTVGQPPTKRARTAADGILGLLSSED